MLNVILLVALAQVTAPGISIDEAGFVTLNEPPEVREQEQRNLKLLQDAEEAYRRYKKDEEGDLATLIAMHEDILDSGMVLVPEVRESINGRLAALHQDYASGVTVEERQRMKEVTARIMRGEPTQEDVDLMIELYGTEHRKKETLKALAQKEEQLAQIPEDDPIRAARLLTEMAMMSQSAGDRKIPGDSIRYYLRARQKALVVVESDGVHKQEARGLADVALLNSESILRHWGDMALCREFMEAYKDDQELVTQLEALITDLTKKQ